MKAGPRSDSGWWHNAPRQATSGLADLSTVLTDEEVSFTVLLGSSDDVAPNETYQQGVLLRARGGSGSGETVSRSRFGRNNLTTGTSRFSAADAHVAAKFFEQAVSRTANGNFDGRVRIE